jgi:cobaltochelatase CobN
MWEGGRTPEAASQETGSAEEIELFSEGERIMPMLSLMLASLLNVFVVESPSYAKEMVVAAREVAARHSQIHFTIRTTEQVVEMPAAELKRHLDEASVIVLGRTYGDVAAKIREAFPATAAAKTVFAAHSDFAIYELNRSGGTEPFRNVTHEQIEQISSGSLNPGNIPQLRRWARTFEYLVAKGPENFRNLFLDLLSNFDAQYKPEPVRIVPTAFIYRNGTVYSDAAAFDPYIQRGRPTVAIIDHDNYYHSGDVELEDRFSTELERAGINAIPIFAGWGKPTETALRDFVKTRREEWNVRAVISLQSFVLGADQSREEVSDLFRELRLPVFRAMRLTKRSPDEWLLSSDGLPWASVYYQVAMPELQGQIEPIPVAAEVERSIDSQTGAAIASFVPIEGRLQRVVERISRWIQLQTKPNSEKRVALIYYNHPPGKQNIGADYLNVPDTIVELLRSLRRDGYDVRDIPPNADVLVDFLTRRGINVANYAAGQRRLLAEQAQALPASDYSSWYTTLDPIARGEVEAGPLSYVAAVIDRALKLEDKSTARAHVERVLQETAAFVDSYPEDLRKNAASLMEEIRSSALDRIDGRSNDFESLKSKFEALHLEGLSGWGKPPGNVMVTDDGNFIIPGMLMGNVFIGPQPQRGWQANADSLHSSNVVPPHHQYLAFYEYLRDVFKADVIVHIGRHSSYEWLPGKQVALADFDYPDIIVGAIPAVYLYTVDGVGEGLQAKRRGLSVIVDHLIPPLKTTELYGPILDLQQLLEQYEGQEVQERRGVIAREVRSKARQYNFTSDLGAGILDAPDDQLIHTLGHYVEELKTTLLPYGLHTFGKRWDDNEIDLLANSMASLGSGDAAGYRKKIEESFPNETASFLGALRGEYVPPGKGNDPVRTPEVLPTGRNFYAIDASVMPTKISYELARQLVTDALATHAETPEKVAAVLWAVETSRDEGTMLSFILQLLGIEPVWDARGLVKELTLVPAEKLGRQRVDVIVTTSGLFRDLFAQLLLLLDRSFRYALAGAYSSIVAKHPSLRPSLDAVLKDVPEAARGRESLEMNAVARHWIDAAQSALKHGTPPVVAGNRALLRIFGPAEGAYGAGISRIIEQAWTWKSRDQVADAYLGRMAHGYSADSWGAIEPEDYRNALAGIQQSFHSRATNLYGVVDNDDYFDYFGGLSMAIERINGKPPENYVLFYADPKQSKVETLEHFLTKEMRSRYYNPEWIQGMMKEGYAGARTISNKFFEFAWGWQVTNPEIMRDWMWNEVTDIYFRDKYRIGVTKWFHDDRRAPAMINMAGILLTAANKGFWKANPETIRELANTLGTMVVRYGPSCSANVCGNKDTVAFSKVWMKPELARAYSRAMAAALIGSGYTGRQSSSLASSSGGSNASRGKPLFDFEVNRRLPVTIDGVLRTLRDQDWGIIFAYMLLVLIPAGLTVFVIRDRCYRRGRNASLELRL